MEKKEKNKPPLDICLKFKFFSLIQTVSRRNQIVVNILIYLNIESHPLDNENPTLFKSDLRDKTNVRVFVKQLSTAMLVGLG